MDISQIVAVKYSLLLGKKIQKYSPEVSDFWLGGYSFTELAQYLKLIGYKDANLKRGVERAIVGHEGGLGIKAYPGLVPQKKLRDRIGRKHMGQSWKRCFENRTGLYALSYQRRREIMSNAGKAAVKVQRRKKIALFGLNKKDLREASKKGVIARGFVPWILEIHPGTRMSEPKYARHMANRADHHYQKGPNTGYVNWKQIALELNNLYHEGREVRTARAVKSEVDWNSRRRNLTSKLSSNIVQ